MIKTRPSPASPYDREERKWMRLTMVWASYYLVAFTLGQIPQFMRLTIWLGVGVVGLMTWPVFRKHIRLKDIPLEGKILGAFVLWALTGALVATDMALFSRHLKMLVEFALIVTSISLILKKSGAAHWFYLAFLGVAVLRVFFGNNPISISQLTQTDGLVARIDAANAVGFLCALGILGMLACLGETRRLWLRLALLAGGAVALYGVVLSASRGAFLALISIIILWSLLCLVGSSRFKFMPVVGAIFLLILSYWIYQFIVKETYMGVRYTKATEMEDGSTLERYNLVTTGFRIFRANPLWGCGLGQFGLASGSGRYAHNDLIEVSVSTGLPGLLLYYSVYWMAWCRLTWSLRYLRDFKSRYRINIARTALLILLISGSLSRPIFITQDTMFLFGVVVGMAHWAEQMARRAKRCASADAPSLPLSGWRPPGLQLSGAGSNSVAGISGNRSSCF